MIWHRIPPRGIGDTRDQWQSGHATLTRHGDRWRVTNRWRTSKMRRTVNEATADARADYCDVCACGYPLEVVRGVVACGRTGIAASNGGE